MHHIVRNRIICTCNTISTDIDLPRLKHAVVFTFEFEEKSDKVFFVTARIS